LIALTEAQDLFDTIPNGLNWNVTGWLVYNDSAAKPAAADVDIFSPYDDFNLVPQDGMTVYKNADYTVTLDLTMDNLGDGAN
jgi:iron transport multicopper oxidase